MTHDFLAEDSAWLNKVIAALEQRGDIDSLIAVALLSESPGFGLGRMGPVAINALRTAAAAAPENRPIAALHLFVCLTAKECDEAAPAAALQRLDPANGAALLPQVRSALQSGNADAIDAALAQLAGAATIDLYQNPNIVSAIDALDGADLPRHPRQHELDDVKYLSAGMLNAYSTYAWSLFEFSGTGTDICCDAVAGLLAMRTA